MASPSNGRSPLRVLITGGSGFTGSALALRLRERGHDVYGLSRHPAGPKSVVVDLLKPVEVNRALENVKPQVVVHLAGISDTRHRRVKDIYESNLIASIGLFEAIIGCGERPRLTIVASSAAVYGGRLDATPVREDAALSPSGHYGLSKRAVEDAASTFAKEFPIQIARPFNYTGPGQTCNFFVPKVVESFARDSGFIEVGALDVYRDISYIDDAVEAYTRLIELEVGFPPINICSGKPTRLADVFEILRGITGRRMEVIVKERLARPDEHKYLVGSRERLDHSLGSWPHIAIEETLEKMYWNALARLRS